MNDVRTIIAKEIDKLKEQGSKETNEVLRRLTYDKWDILLKALIDLNEVQDKIINL